MVILTKLNVKINENHEPVFWLTASCCNFFKVFIYSLLFVTKETLRYQKQVRFPDPTTNFVEGQVSRQLSFSGIVTW